MNDMRCSRALGRQSYTTCRVDTRMDVAMAMLGCTNAVAVGHRRYG